MTTIPAPVWARMSWQARARRRTATLQAVKAAELAHVAAYGKSHPAGDPRSTVRTGILNQAAR